MFFVYFQVRYTGYRDRPLHERQTKFICALREGHTELVSEISQNYFLIKRFALEVVRQYF